jgi:hypothetical protein
MYHECGGEPTSAFIAATFVVAPKTATARIRKDPRCRKSGLFVPYHMLPKRYARQRMPAKPINARKVTFQQDFWMLSSMKTPFERCWQKAVPRPPSCHRSIKIAGGSQLQKMAKEWPNPAISHATHAYIFEISTT